MIARYRRVIAGLLLLLAAMLNMRLDRFEAADVGRHSLFLPSGRYLRFAALGFRELLADVLYVWSIQYYSVERDDRWRHLARFYDAITDLDPRFLSAYSVGAIILSLEAGNQRSAMDLLDKGIAAIPETYILAWEAAFYARDIGDLPRSERYFAIAAERPDAPALVTRWRASMLYRQGDKEEALRVWAEVLSSAPTEYEREVASRWVHDLSLEIRLAQLRSVVSDFTIREGRTPFSWDELIHAGLLDLAPTDALGHPIQYDRKLGTIEPSCSFLRKRR